MLALGRGLQVRRHASKDVLEGPDCRLMHLRWELIFTCETGFLLRYCMPPVFSEGPIPKVPMMTDPIRMTPLHEVANVG